MRTLSFWITMLFLGAMSSSCSKDEEITPENPEMIPVPISDHLLHAYSYTQLTSSNIINRYAALSQDVATGDTVLPVVPTTLGFLPQNASPPWNDVPNGALLLIWQVQGAIIKTDNDSSYGQILNENQAGLFEYAVLQKIDFDQNQIIVEQGLKNSYQAKNHIQIVYVPRYASLSIEKSALLTAPSWNGLTGGIVAFHTWNLVLDGSIDVSGKGFRGGSLLHVGTPGLDAQVDGYVYSGVQGAEKGESLAGFTTEYDALGGTLGRGAPANGGGGGNAQNAGGGGGANISNGQPWTGIGFVDTTNRSIWCLDLSIWDQGVCPAPELSKSSGGGRGGYTSSTEAPELTIYAPGNKAWGGNYRQFYGGLGGHPLTSNPANILRFGGGGGAGHYQGPDSDSWAGPRGGRGGGVVLISADKISGSGQIIVDGEPGQNAASGYISGTNVSELQLAGAGGGGAGGSIVLFSRKISSPAGSILLSAIGGKGGDQVLSDTSSKIASGPGGGGSGGFIYIPQDASIRPGFPINGGVAGTTNSKAMTKFVSNGATSGATGRFNRMPFSTNLDFQMELLPQNLTPAPQGTLSYRLSVENKGLTFTNKATLQLKSDQIADKPSWQCKSNEQTFQACSGGGGTSSTIPLSLAPLAQIKADVTIPISSDSACQLATYQADLVQEDLGLTTSQKISLTLPPNVVWKFHNAINDDHVLYSSWLDIQESACANEPGWGIRIQLPKGASLKAASGVGWTCDKTDLVANCTPLQQPAQGSIWIDWIPNDAPVAYVQANAYLLASPKASFKTDTFGIGKR